MCCGGFLAAVAFAVSAVISITLENTYPVLPSTGEAQVRIYDTTSCQYSFSTANNEIAGAPINGYYQVSSVPITQENQLVSFVFTSTSTTCKNQALIVPMNESTAYGIYINKFGQDYYIDNVAKSEDGYPLIRTLAYDNSTNITYTHIKSGKEYRIGAGDTELLSIEYVGKYKIDVIDTEVEFKLGGTYTVIINQDNLPQKVTVTQPNSIHILWLIPQYIIITAAEIMFSITGLEFSYSQAPSSMKSVLTACFLLTTAFGNLIIVLIESAKIFEKQSNDFWLYTCLMVVDMLIFMWLAIRYTYITPDEISETEEMEPPKKRLSNGIDNPGFDKNN